MKTLRHLYFIYRIHRPLGRWKALRELFRPTPF